MEKYEVYRARTQADLHLEIPAGSLAGGLTEESKDCSESWFSQLEHESNSSYLNGCQGVVPGPQQQHCLGPQMPFLNTVNQK